MSKISIFKRLPRMIITKDHDKGLMISHATRMKKDGRKVVYKQKTGSNRKRATILKYSKVLQARFNKRRKVL